MARRDALLRLHKTLSGRRDELIKRLSTDLEDLARAKHSSASGDPADAAFDSTGEELSSQLAELESRELNQIQRAINLLKKGCYGQCEGCNSKIPVARLNALPYSTLCIKCQREAERDSNWLADRRGGNWATLTDGTPGEEPEIRLSDLEMDYSK